MSEITPAAVPVLASTPVASNTVVSLAPKPIEQKIVEEVQKIENEAKADVAKVEVVVEEVVQKGRDGFQGS